MEDNQDNTEGVWDGQGVGRCDHAEAEWRDTQHYSAWDSEVTEADEILLKSEWRGFRLKCNICENTIANKTHVYGKSV